MKKNKGFTLIEVLVVISLIVILMGFVVPKMLGYRDKAKDIKAINTAKQIQTAIITTAAYGEDSVTEEDIKTLTGVQIKSIDNKSGEILISFTSDKVDYSMECGINNESKFKVAKGSKQLYPQ